MIPYAPGAYNAWIGNRFVIPPLGQYARPAYAEAVAPAVAADPALAAAMPQAVDPRAMPMDAGFQGGSPTSDQPGVGMNAVSPSFGDFARSAITGPVTAFGSLLGQTAVNALTGRPDRPIERIGFMDLGRNVADALGFGEGSGSFSGAGGRAASAPETFGGVSELDMALASAGSPSAGGYDGGSYGPDVQAAAEAGGFQGSGMYAKGGTVNALIGPNPPGPDDGFGGLARGEFVVRKSQAQKHRGLLEAINKGKVSKKKARGLLD